MTPSEHNANSLQTVLQAVMDIKGEVGEIKGRVTEMVHTTNNSAAKIDALGTAASSLSRLTQDVAGHEARITVLEVSERERTGAMKFTTWLLRVLPVGILSAVIGFLGSFFAKGH